MAKEKKVIDQREFFGTKSEWVIGKNPYPQIGSVFDGATDIIAKDEKGHYFTHTFYVGGVMDPYRVYNRMPASDADVAKSLNPPAVVVPPPPIETLLPDSADGVIPAVIPASAVICDATNNTPETIAKNELHADIIVPIPEPEVAP